MIPHHEPAGYDCPFCRAIRAGSYPADRDPGFVCARPGAVALISNRWWPNNPGHALVVPTVHVENLYEITPESNHAVQDLVQEVAIAMRESYGCEGISTRQHNEPAGSQDVWHLHVHVLPRYTDDHLYSAPPHTDLVTGEQQRPYAERLRNALGG